MDLYELITPWLTITRGAALGGILLMLASFVRVIAPLEGLRASARATGAWVIFVALCPELILQGGNGGWVFGGAVVLGVCSFLLDMRWDPGLRSWRPSIHEVAVLGWVPLVIVLGGIGHCMQTATDDLRKLHHPLSMPELTLFAFESTAISSAFLTDAVCHPELVVRWTTGGGSSSSDTHHEAAALVSPFWKPDQPVRTWLTDPPEGCTDGPIGVVVRDGPLDEQIRPALPRGIEVPDDATTARIPPSVEALTSNLQLSGGLYVAVLVWLGLWWLIGIPLVTPTRDAERWQAEASWQHDAVVIDLGPVVLPRTRRLRPLALGLALLVGWGIALPLVRMLAAAVAAGWSLQPILLSWSYLGIGAVAVIAVVGVGMRRAGGRQELRISPLTVTLTRVRGRRRVVAWEIPTHAVETCTPAPEGASWRGVAVVHAEGRHVVPFADPLDPGMDLAALVQETAAAAKSGRGGAWEVPAALRALLDR